MNQNEFNKKEQFESLVKTAKNKGLGYEYILAEVKRSKWNINQKQAEHIANMLNVKVIDILAEADVMAILNVDKKMLKLLRKQKQND